MLKTVKKARMPLAIARLSALFLAVLHIYSCSYDNSYPHLYDKTGFDQGRIPAANQNINSRNNSPYYQPVSPYAPAPYYGQGNQAPAPTYAPAPQPVYQQPYQYAPPQPSGGSRFYTNPYAIPPAGEYYAPRYDVDQYYVPPNYYNNVEPQDDGRSLKSSRSY